MTEPQGFLAVIAEYDALPVLIAVSEIAVISKLVPTYGDAKTSILLASGERIRVGTEYASIVQRLAQSVGKDEMRKGN